MHLSRCLRNQQQALGHLIDMYAKYPPTGLTMKRIVEFGRIHCLLIRSLCTPTMFSSRRGCQTIVHVSSERTARSARVDDEGNGTFALAPA